VGACGSVGGWGPLRVRLLSQFGFGPGPAVVAALLLGALGPVSFSYFVFLLTCSYLTRDLCVYICVAGFCNAALTIAVKTLLFAGCMVWSGQYSWQVVLDNYVGILPLLLFPGALLSGMAITLLVVFKPRWVCTFFDRDYLNNK